MMLQAKRKQAGKQQRKSCWGPDQYEKALHASS
jgi:hypothetical protein